MELDVKNLVALLEDIFYLARGHLKSKACDDNGNNIALATIVAMIEKENIGG